MDAVKKKSGRPPKPTIEGEDPKLVQKRLYMRKYTKEIKKDIFDLSKMEEDCDKELKRIKKEKAKLLDQLESANKQASDILKSATQTKPTKKQLLAKGQAIATKLVSDMKAKKNII